MKVLGIVGSPRKGGNTDILVERALQGVKAKGGDGEVVFLRDIHIEFCKGCGDCSKGGNCSEMDGMQELYRKLNEAEGLIFGTPVYMNNLSAQMKTFVDRCGAFMEIEETQGGPPKVKSRLRAGKKALLIVVCACPTPEGAKLTIGHLREFCKWLGIEVVGEVVGTGLSRMGDVYKRPDLLEKTFRTGESLLTKQPK